MPFLRRNVVLQEILWGGGVAGALWPFQPLGWHYLRPPHLHHQPEVLLVRRGKLRLRVGAESFAMRQGQLAFIPTSVAHVVETLEPDADFWVLQPELVLVERALARVAELALPRGVRSGAQQRLTQLLPDPPVIQLSSHHFDIIEERATLTWQSYLSAWQGESPASAARPWMPPWSVSGAAGANRLLVDTLAAVFEALLAEESAAPPRRLARVAFDALSEEPLLSRGELCRSLDVSEGHLSRTFPALFGASLVAQRARLRLTSFLALARQAQPPNLLHACLAAGFGSYAQLHRVFSAHSGFSPRAYLHQDGHLEAARITL